MTSIESVLLAVLQAAAMIIFAPLLTGIMRKAKARTQKRVGPPVLQAYYDIAKLFRKDEVVSDQASWIFRAAPWVNIASMATAALFIPVFLVYSPFGTAGDLLLVVGLFALARFFTMLAGLDVSSSFGGLGSSREMMFSAMLEPAIFLAVFVAAVTYGGTDLNTLVGTAAGSSILSHPQLIFAAIAMFVVALAETGRLPFDNPSTHLELTMVHEAMVLEYSGRGLALMELSKSVKQVILFALIANIFVPWGIAQSVLPAMVGVGAAAFAAKVLAISVLVALLESSVAKWRLFRLPDLIAVSVASSMIGMVLYFL